MKLITKRLEPLLTNYPIYSQDKRGGNAMIICKLSFGVWAWYVLEAEKIEDGDWTFFGIIARNDYKEYGYINLSELEKAFPKLKRDTDFTARRVSDCPELREWAAKTKREK